jgi:protein-S-isoprenylcysteine O-methyltransferase Ste14
VALEVFYMVTPFAAYLYGVYGPGLDALRVTEATGWLVGFFLPHIVRETTSPLVTWHAAIGAALLVSGLVGFGVGAVQVYWRKLRRAGPVVGGVYRWIRNPQYVALMVSSLGMLLLWPRYLVLFGFVTVCFAYVLLARAEERICRRDFPEYDAYAARTGAFLPAVVERPFRRIPWPQRRSGRGVATLAVYAAVLFVAFGGARRTHDHAVSSVYVHATAVSVYVSLGRLDPDTIAGLARVAAAHPEVQAALGGHAGPDARFINYVMPVDLEVSEVPMHIPETSGRRSTCHFSPIRPCPDHARGRPIAWP